MPRLRRRPKTKTRRDYTNLFFTQQLELLCGWSPPPDDPNHIDHDVAGGEFLTLDDVRLGWEASKDNSFITESHPGERPWAWWQFDSPEARDEAIPECVQLAQMGLLSRTEQEKMRTEFRINAEYAEKSPYGSLPLDIGHALEMTGALTGEDVKTLRDIEEWKRKGWRE